MLRKAVGISRPLFLSFFHLENHGKPYSSSSDMNDIYEAVDIILWNIKIFKSRENLQISLNRTKNQKNGIQNGIQNWGT